MLHHFVNPRSLSPSSSSYQLPRLFHRTPSPRPLYTDHRLTRTSSNSLRDQPSRPPLKALSLHLACHFKSSTSTTSTTHTLGPLPLQPSSLAQEHSSPNPLLLTLNTSSKWAASRPRRRRSTTRPKVTRIAVMPLTSRLTTMQRSLEESARSSCSVRPSLFFACLARCSRTQLVTRAGAGEGG